MAGFHAFRSFQRNQKLWLAILGVGTMISFIILPPLMQLFTGSSGGGPANLATSRRFGNLSEKAVFDLGQSREHLGRFYIVLYQHLADPNDQERQLALQALEMTAGEYERQLDSEDIVNNWLLAQYAKEKGMSIDKMDIVTHLTQITGGYLSDAIYQQVLNAVGMTERQLEYYLAGELLTARVYETFGTSLGTIPPSTRWEWFQRLNRQITAEVVAVPVDQFVAKVGEPSTAQLQVLFNENKEKPFNPTLADYGFFQPTRLAFQYVKAAPNQKVLDSITDEEIKAYYDANKETLFRKEVRPVNNSPIFPGLPGMGNTGGLGGFTQGGSARSFPTPPRRPTGGIKLTDENTATNSTESTPEAKPEEKPVTEAKPEVKPEEKPATETKPAEKPVPTEEKKPEATEPEKKETSSSGSVRTRFVSYRADEEPKAEAKPETPKPEEPKAEAKPETPKPEEPKAEAKPETPKPEEPKAEAKPETPKSEEPKAEAKPETPKPEEPKAEAKPETPKPEEPKAEAKPETPKSEEPKAEAKPETPKPEEPKAEAKPETPKPEEPKAEAKPETPKTETELPKPETPVDLSILYKPLNEVKDQIRQTLALEKTLKSVPLIEEKMREYFQTYNIHIDKEEAVPPMPDLTEFVKELGLELKTVPLGTIYESIKSEFARGTSERAYLIQLFNESPIVFEPKNVENGSYVLWVTEIQSETKPEKLDDVKDTVLKRWKEIEARPLALKRAEELAAEARSSEKSLAETFTGRSDVPVVETEPFTYKSYGQSMYAAFFAMRGRAPRIGEVCEKGVAVGDSEIDNKQIFAPGTEFMDTVSSLAIGEIGVVFNQPKTVAYVVRVTGSNPSEDVLWERFQTSNIMEYRLAGQPELISEARTAWLNKIYEEVGFKWIRKPEAVRRSR